MTQVQLPARSGVLLINKPPGITSHDAVARTRRIMGTRKVGHAGTLDPMATGLLILGVNSSTRLLTFVVGLDKEYLATVRLGQSTSTDDAEGETVAVGDPKDIAALTDSTIVEAIASLTGPIEQRPSSVSAIKVAGRRAYDRVRAGEEVQLESRPVTVSAFELLATTRGEFVDLDVRVECSTGTYVRALARDLGAKLGVGGHLTALRRTRVGPFSIANAGEIDETLSTRLLPPAEVARRLFATINLTADQAKDITHGKRIDLPVQLSSPIAAIAPDDRLVGVIEVVDGRARVITNFPPDEATP